MFTIERFASDKTEAHLTACDAGRTLLILDTRRGDTAEQLYARYGYTQAGIIPQFARSANGTLDDTVYFYRLLE